MWFLSIRSYIGKFAPFFFIAQLSKSEVKIKNIKPQGNTNNLHDWNNFQAELYSGIRFSLEHLD